jgi:hypothetical protein
MTSLAAALRPLPAVPAVRPEVGRGLTPSTGHRAATDPDAGTTAAATDAIQGGICLNNPV